MSNKKDNHTQERSRAIAFFDVDDTLVKGNSGYFTSFHLVRNGILKKRRIAQAVYYSLAALFFHQDIEKIYQIAINDMAGSTWERVFQLGKKCFEEDIKPRLYSEGIKLIREHKNRGHHIVLLTSAPYMLIRVLQDFLGIEESYCMGPEIVKNVLTDKLQLPICHAEGKVHFAEISAKKHDIPLKDCYFYTDHTSDLPLLKKIGHPVTVNPGHHLTKIAQEKGWPILRFNETLGGDSF